MELYFLKLKVAFILVLYTSSFVNGQDCPILLPSDLGNTTAPSSIGLFPDIAVAAGRSRPSVHILEINVVCLCQGILRDTFRHASFVVRYLRASDNMEIIEQVESSCSLGQWGLTSGFAPLIEMNPVATLNTALRTDCILCIDPSLTTAVVSDSATHCAGKRES